MHNQRFDKVSKNIHKHFSQEADKHIFKIFVGLLKNVLSARKHELRN
jgi:hypothetical protein